MRPGGQNRGRLRREELYGRNRCVGWHAAWRCWSGTRSSRRMLVYGEDEAADELERLVKGWVDQGRPGADHVQMTVSFRERNLHDPDALAWTLRGSFAPSASPSRTYAPWRITSATRRSAGRPATAPRASPGSRPSRTSIPCARPERLVAEEELRALGRPGRAGVPLALRRDLRCAAGIAAEARAVDRGTEDVPDRHARLLGAPPGRGRPRRRPDDDLAATPCPSRRGAEADRHEPARDGDSELRRSARRRGRLDGRGHARGGHRGPREARGRRPVRRRAGAQGVRCSPSACSLSSTPWSARATAP